LQKKKKTSMVRKSHKTAAKYNITYITYFISAKSAEEWSSLMTGK